MFSKIALRILPWLLVVVLALAFWLVKMPSWDSLVEPSQTTVYNSTLLTQIEALGKLELVRYRFREITELKQEGERVDIYVGWIPMGGDAEITLFSTGEAVGCIDLSQVNQEDLNTQGDTIYVTLPEPELCYFKIDLENTRVYNFEADRFVDEEQFLDSAYKTAEREVRNAALKSNILEQTTENAHLMLKPLLESISGKTVVFQKEPLPLISGPLD